APTVPAPAAEAPAEMIGRYKLLEKIGEGGFGEVWMAEQREPVKRRVALKILKPGMDSRQIVARFEAERQALAMMDHPHIAKIHDAGTTDSARPFFVMELVRGTRITDYCDQHQLTTGQRLDLFIKVCQAIQHAHQKGIIHRDIKPSNVLVTVNDGSPVPKVIDFGIAKATQQDLTDKTVFTQFQQFIGTPAYISPEQAEMSSLDIDTRADIYSLGVLLYELLVGQTPFDAREMMQGGFDALRKIIREREPQRPSTRLNTLPGDARTTAGKRRQTDAGRLVHQLQGDLDWIVMKCLEKDRTRRYETANGLAADITRHLNNEPVAARPPSAAYRFQKAFRRNKLVFAAAGAVAGALVLGVVISAWQAVRAQQASQAASRQRLVAEAAQADAQARQREAETERQRANAQATNALVSQEHSRRLLYAADMNLAQQSVNQNNLGRARRLLDRHRPQPGEEDLRGWEWRYLWHQCQSDAFAVLTNRPARGFSVSFSPDGAQLAVGYSDGRVELWDTTRRVLLRELHTNGPLAHVAFSPRSPLLAATAGPGILKLHDLSSGRESVLWQGANSIRELSFTPDGSRLLAFTFGPEGPSAVTLDPAQGIALTTHATSGANLHTGIARLSSDRKQLYLSQVGGTGRLSVNCLEPDSGRNLWRTELGSDFGVTAMALSPDDRILVTATGFEDATIRVLDAETGRLITRLEGHTGWVGELTFSRDGRWLVSAAADQTLRLWETAGWMEARVFRGHEDEVHTVAFSPDGRRLASGSKDGAILLWDVAATTSAYGYRPLPPEVVALAEYAPGLAIAAGTDARGLKTARIRLADLGESPVSVGSDLTPPFTYLPPNLFAQYDQTHQLRIAEYRESGAEDFREVVGPNLVRHPGVPQVALAYCPDPRRIAWGERAGRVQVAGLDPAAQRWQWPSELSHPTPLTFSPDGTLLVLAGQQGERRMELRETTTGRLVLHSDIPMDIPEYQPRVRFANGGRTLVAANRKREGMQVVFWDLTQPEQPPVRFEERGNLYGASVSPDGRWVAVGSQAGIVMLYDAATLKRRPLLGMMHAVSSVTFSPDSRTLVAGGGGREAVKLWHVETGQELLTLPGKGNLLEDVAFAEGGNTLLLGRFRQPGSWQMWRAPSRDEIERAEAARPNVTSAGTR
ncbi:MAG: protein kinase, partial [Verrucomicrobiales bacterium]|nr:protein kinase [Verrucomicrobiales bacterium]